MNNINPQQALTHLRSNTPYSIHYELHNSKSGALNCSSMRITISETGEDYIEVETNVVDGIIPDILTAPRYTLTVGLTFPDLIEQCLDMLELTLTARSLQEKPDGTRLLRLQSFEALIRDAGVDTPRTYDSSSDITKSIKEIITVTLPDQAVQSHLAPSTTFLQTGDTLEWSQQKNQWALITEMCDGAEARCYHDGKTFKITRQSKEKAQPIFTVPLSSLMDYQASISRDNFANSVTVTYQNGASGRVDQTSGAYAVAAIGRKTLYEEIPREGTSQQARSRARAQLQRALIAGNKLTITVSHLLLTLRPADTIRVHLHSGNFVGIIETIEFDIAQITTNITLINTEKENN